MLEYLLGGLYIPIIWGSRSSSHVQMKLHNRQVTPLSVLWSQLVSHLHFTQTLTIISRQVSSRVFSENLKFTRPSQRFTFHGKIGQNPQQVKPNGMLENLCFITKLQCTYGVFVTSTPQSCCIFFSQYVLIYNDKPLMKR